MKRSPDNQINASFIDISRIKWLVLYCGRLSSAQLVPLQAPKQRPIIDPHPVKQTAYRRDIKDNGYKSVFTNSWPVRQRNRSWIKGLDKNPQKTELIQWQQCLLSGATEPCPRENTLRHTYVYTRHPAQCHDHVWRVDMAPGKTCEKRNACWDVRRSAVEKNKLVKMV